MAKQIQIHKALAEVLGIEPNKDGHYFCSERIWVPISKAEQAMALNDINLKIKLETNGKTRI